jgi:isopenicillin N synthase-like dioxygenase
MSPLWPSEKEGALPGFKQKALRFMRLVDGVVVKCMRCFARALELPDDFFLQHMRPDDDDNGTALFMNHYPSLAGKNLPEGAHRIWPHTDFEVITLLFQNRAGLEVCPGMNADSPGDVLDDNKWSSVDPIPGAITCNLGDALQYWTDGCAHLCRCAGSYLSASFAHRRIKSTYHRVRVPRPDEYQGDRYSLAYFANAGLHTRLQGPSGRYPPITFLDILARRAATVPLVSDPVTGKVRVESLAGKAGGPDFAS